MDSLSSGEALRAQLVHSSSGNHEKLCKVSTMQRCRVFHPGTHVRSLFTQACPWKMGPREMLKQKQNQSKQKQQQSKEPSQNRCHHPRKLSWSCSAYENANSGSLIYTDRTMIHFRQAACPGPVTQPALLSLLGSLKVTLGQVPARGHLSTRLPLQPGSVAGRGPSSGHQLHWLAPTGMGGWAPFPTAP